MRRSNHGFTLVELLVSMVVLAVLVLFVSMIVNSAATITTLGNKHIDADSQARQLLDRMAVDFAQMVKRDDLDFFAKGTVAPKSLGGAMTVNDQIAFYSGVGGYYPATSTSSQHSPISLVAYRINSQNRLERMGKGLVWNGATTDTPIIFMPLTIAATWAAATNATTDADYEEIGPHVFRFEYCYVLTGGTRSITPPVSVSGIAAIVVDIATTDPRSKALLDNSKQVAPPNDNITKLAGRLVDYTSGTGPGQLLAQWQSVLDGTTDMPRPAISGIRLYERHFYLSPPTL